MVTKLNLSRDQLASFLTDQQQIRQFEMLFKIIDAIAPNVVNEINFVAGSAQATALQALAQIAALQGSVQAMQLAPISNNIELGHDVNGILPLANLPPSIKSNRALIWLSI